MDKKNKEINKLRKILEHWENIYYTQNSQTVSDYEYDSMLSKLYSLENNTKYASNDLENITSITNRVGGKPDINFNLSYHHIPMLSIDNVFNIKDFLNLIVI